MFTDPRDPASRFRRIARSATSARLNAMFAAALISGSAVADEAAQGPLARTFANPLSLPDYPRGIWTKKPSPNNDRWIKGAPQDFRELADPSVLYEDGKWYLYPSAGMAYVTEDFLNWTFHPIEPTAIGDGYAPTVVKSGSKFLMTGCFAGLWEASHPLGPFRLLGPIRKPDGTSIEAKIFDPMLFADDDGALYVYYMVSGACVGAPLDPKNPTQMLADPQPLFGFRPDQEWERYGDYNEDSRRSFFEGPWMFKHNGTYHLTFTGPGTSLATYALGAYKAQSPLGPFTYQKNNPILRKTTGVVPGSGHGSIVRGPNNTLWAFVTSVVGNYHVFERRIGLFPVGVNADGDVFGLPVRDVPQFAPGVKADPQNGNEAGWLPVNVRTIATASSVSPGQTADYAIDDNCRTWWQPSDSDAETSLTVDLKTTYEIAAVRILWAEPGLDYAKGIVPGPIRYRVLAQSKNGGPWETAFDASQNDRDFLIDYRTFPAVKARRVKLEILEAPKGLRPGVLEFTVFGRPPVKTEP